MRSCATCWSMTMRPLLICDRMYLLCNCQTSTDSFGCSEGAGAGDMEKGDMSRFGSSGCRAKPDEDVVSSKSMPICSARKFFISTAMDVSNRLKPDDSVLA